MLNKLMKLFGIYAGNGRAWMLQTEPIRTIIKSFLSISVELKETFARLPEQAFPWLCDDDTIPYWEDHYGLTVNYNDTIDVRRSACVFAYIATGGQAPGYLEYVFKQSGFDITITENLDGVDLGTEWDTSTLKLSNGNLYWFETSGAITYRDPIDKPDSLVKWKKVFLVDVDIGYDQFDLFKRLMLKYKPQHTVAIVRDLSTTKYDIDENLVTDVVPPTYDIDENLMTSSVPPVYDLDGQLYFL